MLKRASATVSDVAQIPLERSSMDRVRVLFADQLNLARGKYLPSEMAAKGKARFCLGAYALTYAKTLVPAPGSGMDAGLPDIEAVFDPEDLRDSWEPGTKIALADLLCDDKSADLCGRSALKRAIAAWQSDGLSPKVGLEAEAYIFKWVDSKWQPYETPGAFVYGTGPFADPEGLVDDIWETAYRCGLPIESINAEFDTPQFELAMRYDDALKACDDFFLFRQMAREILIRRGYLLSFMPKPIADLSGTGLHINMSFADQQGNNAFAGGTSKGALSPLVSGCIAGLLHHLEGLGAIVAPTVNSYARLKPGSLSGYWANWGYDHRGVAVRVSGEEGAAARIEFRSGDCAASPYFATAAALWAARLGVKHEYALPAPELGDGLESVCTDHHIADSLGQSLDALEADTLLCDAIGKPMIDNFVAIKRVEVEELAGKSHAEIFDYYAYFI